MIFEGIALGTQPLISFTTGASLKERVTKFRNLAFIITLLIAVIGVITLYSIPEIIIYIFAEDNLALQPEAIKGMSLYL
ncbi:MATE family efflux transporter [Photobacterium carnosum]|uniref:MATE family efflux transporter n=1 Tax=Photobacterium carnosum TaxID=2023717 RepID=UPI001E566243|nr:MATE family efflux transporter [Photobacterium carnosum]